MGWLWFLGTLVPIVIGIVSESARKPWPTRYAYLPSIGFFLAFVFARDGSR